MRLAGGSYRFDGRFRTAQTTDNIRRLIGHIEFVKTPLNLIKVDLSLTARSACNEGAAHLMGLALVTLEFLTSSLWLKREQAAKACLCHWPPFFEVAPSLRTHPKKQRRQEQDKADACEVTRIPEALIQRPILQPREHQRVEQEVSNVRKCPACGSRDYVFRGRKKIASQPGRAEDIETRFRCKPCAHVWKERATPGQPC